MQFDSSIQTQNEVKRALHFDPRLIRYSVVKIGDKLGGVNGAMENITGHVPWNESGESAHAYGNILQNQRVWSAHAPLRATTYTPEFVRTDPASAHATPTETPNEN